MNARHLRRWLGTPSRIAAWLFVLVAPLLAQTVPTNGLIGYWRGDGNLNDSSATPNNGTSTNGTVTFATGVVGSAFSFTSGSYVSIPDNAAYNIGSGDFSAGFWFKLNTSSSPWVLLGQDDGGGSFNKWVLMYNYSAAPGTFDLHLNGSTMAELYTAQISLDPNTWYHLALTRSGTTMTYYLNGTAAGTASFSGAIPNPTAPLTLGYAEPNFHFSGGLMDEVVLYNRTLTAGEVAALAAVPEPAVCALVSGVAALACLVVRRRYGACPS